MSYWIRSLTKDQSQPCVDSKKFKTRAEATEYAKTIKEISYYYVMTLDAFGECFIDLVRPHEELLKPRPVSSLSIEVDSELLSEVKRMKTVNGVSIRRAVEYGLKNYIEDMKRQEKK